MIKLTIEENNRIYKYYIDDKYTDFQREIRLFSQKRPILIRQPNGKWYERISDCNYCGACCRMISGNKYLGTKELDGEIVCKWLKKIRTTVDGNIPLNKNASSPRKIGSPLKSKENAEVYICTNPEAPFGCSYGAFKIEGCENCYPTECTIKFRELKYDIL